MKDIKLVDTQFYQASDEMKSFLDEFNFGFAVYEVINEEDNQTIDYRFLYGNTSYKKIINNQRFFDIYPKSSDLWTKKKTTFDYFSSQLDTWYQVSSYAYQNRLILLLTDITKYKNMEHLLKKNEKLYWTIVKTSPDGISIVDLDGIVLSASDKILEMFDIENENEMIGTHFSNYVDSQDQEKALTTMANLVQLKQMDTNQFTMKKKDGSTFVLEANAALLYDENSKPEAIIIVQRDITKRLDEERKNQEKEVMYQKQLQHSHDLLDYIINYNHSSIAVLDNNMNYIYFSRKYLKQCHLENIDIIGKNHYDIFPNLPQKWHDAHQKALNGEALHKDRDYYIKADGSIEYSRWECRPWYEQDGSIGGIVLYSEVIDDQIEIEEELKNKVKEINLEKRRVEATLRSISDSVVVTNEKGYIEFVNDIAVDLLGYKSEELIGEKFSKMIKMHDEYLLDVVENPIDVVIRTKKKNDIVHHTLLLSKNNKKYYIENNASPIMNDEGELTGVILIMKDISDRKKQQKEIEYLATHDTFTGCYNRRFMIEELTRLDHKKYYPLGLLMVDINGLKLVNDVYGYTKGDEAVKKVALLLKQQCDRLGLVSRIGGGEFLVLIPNTDAKKLEMLKTKIKEEMKRVAIESINITLSMGSEIKIDSSIYLSDFYTEVENKMYKNKLINSKSARNNTIKAILKTLTEKYEKEKIHSERVSQFCRKMGEALNLNIDDINELEMAGMYHDIGKISIPDAIINKPGRLTDDEFAIMKTHTLVGYQILKAADAYSNLAEYALMHHERWDGKGYPNGLKSTEIPKFSRIICIADAYEAMTTNRVYRAKITKEDAVKEIKRCAGSQFDPDLAKVFVTKVLQEKWD